jgi:TrmH family RNA methyltransferase
MAVDLDIPATPISDRELKRISQLTNAHGCLAVFEKPPPAECDFSGLILALDGVRDPGNLGTIVRLCDWFGVGHLLCSFDTVDCYNPKVVQASMGSLARVAVHYVDLEAAFGQREMPVYASDMHAPSVYETKLSLPAILVMGNEGQGISKAIMDQATQRIAIPSYGEGQSAESLNVAAATAILLGEFRRSTEM